jgi:protein-L-isoaspartate(D-aspartate) O-methyltransferase
MLRFSLRLYKSESGKALGRCRNYQPMFKNSHPEDSAVYQARRRELVEELQSKGIQDPLVLAALRQVPRHLFFSPEFRQFAYRDEAFPILHGQTISQPYTVAYQSQLLMAKPGMKVLEIGSGSGYQAAVLEAMQLQVVSVEIIPGLVALAAKTLKLLDSKVKVFQSDGSEGYPAEAPYDRILVTAGAPAVPSALVAQLKPGGILVIPVGKGRNDQKMVRVYREADGIRHEVLGDFRFVPLTGKNGWKEEKK